MNKWYKSAPCKGILLLLEHLLAMVMIICVTWLLSYPSDNVENLIRQKPEDTYADSQGFEDFLLETATRINWAEKAQENYETDGAYDKNKIVDIRQYDEDMTITGKNESGLAYTLGDLVDWGSSGSDDTADMVVVCKRADGTYHYYYEEEFRSLIEKGELVFANVNEDVLQEYGMKNASELVAALKEGWGNESLFRNIEDGEGNQLYESCWRYDGSLIQEKAAPLGAKSILEIVNTNPEWNGKLNEAMRALSYSIDSLYSDVYQAKDVIDRWSEGNTNVSYMLVDLENNRIYTNQAKYKDFQSWKENIGKIKKLGKYVIAAPKLVDFESNINVSASLWKESVGLESDSYICAFGVDTEYPIQDDFYQSNKIYEEYAPYVQTVFVMGILSGLGALIILVWLTIVAGRANKEEGVALNFIDRIWTEFFLLIAGGALGFAVTFLYEAALNALSSTYRTFYVTDQMSSSAFLYNPGSEMASLAELALVGACGVLVCMTGLILWLGLVRRGKAKTLWTNSLLRRICKTVAMMVSNMNIIWKTVLGLGIFLAIQWLSMMTANVIVILLALATEVLLFVYVVRRAIGRNKICKGVTAIASGEVSYQIPLQGLQGSQLTVAQQLNQIGDGLDKALEESMKNERLKTDLITNVSHDIKTPLTSIINYIALLKLENFEDPKIQNYLKVLEEKAFRLKTLTEDVVEASKVSSGNVNLEMMNLNLVELVNQTSAEFEEKFEERYLQLVMKMPNEPVVVHADGRRLWRVFSNLFNNAAKYAMEHSRVYVEVTQNKEEVCFSIKNVSEQPLNISADELTERFIRGDISRSTEGSGLGLSIAKNLVQLQGGRFELYLDGDFFKALVCFPRVISANVQEEAPAESMQMEPEEKAAEETTEDSQKI